MRRLFPYGSLILVLVFSFSLSGCVRSASSSNRLPVPAAPTATAPVVSRPTLPSAPTRTPQPPAATRAQPGPLGSPASPLTVTQPTPAATMTATVAVTPTTTPAAPQYEVQPGSPVSTTNFLHPESGCNWVGLGGQVFSADGSAVTGIKVVVVGSLDNRQVAAVATTGRSTAVGPGGYELALSLAPVQTSGDLKAQLFNQTGQSISDPVPFKVSNDCHQSQVLLNFVAVRQAPAWTSSYLPMIVRSPDNAK